MPCLSNEGFDLETGQSKPLGGDCTSLLFPVLHTFWKGASRNLCWFERLPISQSSFAQLNFSWSAYRLLWCFRYLKCYAYLKYTDWIIYVMNFSSSVVICWFVLSLAHLACDLIWGTPLSSKPPPSRVSTLAHPKLHQGKSTQTFTIRKSSSLQLQRLSWKALKPYLP